LCPLPNRQFGRSTNSWPASKQSDSGYTVTVTGGKTGVNTGLNLNIPAGVGALWSATYTGAAISSNYLIDIDGDAGASIDYAAAETEAEESAGGVSQV
jgi:hypothetical protein